jgi:hypothetical protein
MFSRSSDLLRNLLICAATLFLVANVSAGEVAPEGPPGPDGLPKAAPGRPWKTFSGTRKIETFPYPTRDVIPAARQVLVTDGWEIYFVDSARGVVVSKWKALRHPLVKYFMGKIRMRCVVHIEPLGPRRSQITFRADMTSHEDLARNPMIGDAKRAYSEAAQKYMIKVRQFLYDHRFDNRRRPVVGKF